MPGVRLRIQGAENLWGAAYLPGRLKAALSVLVATFPEDFKRS
jgi:hypothetical protein